MRYIFPVTKIQSVCLPSTSPANAAWNMERLLSAWQIILKLNNPKQNALQMQSVSFLCGSRFHLFLQSLFNRVGNFFCVIV